MSDDREQLQDPDADWDREDPSDPELDALIARGEDLPSDDEEFASPPEPEGRTTPDPPS